MNTITVQELKARIDAGTAPKIIDVREVWEFEADHINAENIPMGTIGTAIANLQAFKDQELVVCCRSGGRSGNVTAYLQGNGFSKVMNLTGGMLAWKQYIDPKFNVQ